MKLKKYKLLFLFAIIGCIKIQAQTTVASIFSDNMVLQRNVKIPVWGFAKANETIVVQFHHQTKKTTANKNGKWSVSLDKEIAGGPFVLSIKGKNKIEITNVLVGEVWLCSGQSNMEWTVGQSDNAKNEIDNATFPTIRHIKIPKEINTVPSSDFKNSTWQVCSPETVANFTGIGYFYAKELNQKLHVPIGIINATWGGTNIETWISRDGFESRDFGNEEFNEMIAQMPKVNLNSLLDLKMNAAQNRIESLQKTKFTTDKEPFYKDFNFDDSSWLELQQPGIWEEQSLGNFDGVVWLRKHFTLTEINNNITLEIPAIDDTDETYVNGIKIGETIGWDKKRSYLIPATILKIGTNVIAIRVTDTGGGGGIHGDDDGLRILTNATQIPLSGAWKFQVAQIKNAVNENEFPSLCYNAMIHPLLPFAFKGVLWYQGESNASRAFQYQKTFPLLIKDWRSKFNSDFPFFYVQLASFTTKGNSNEGCSWAELREAQTNTIKVKNTGMVVTTDLVTNPKDIHPTNKQDVSKRLVSIALENAYENESPIKIVTSSGPKFKSFENKDGKTIVIFDNIGSGLLTTDKYGYIKGFEVAGENHQFYFAKAEIFQNKIVLICNKVPIPIAIRFGWIGDATECNLFNNEGFPAIPFRTDHWKLSTEDVKYKISIP